jgi:hypothetical protein
VHLSGGSADSSTARWGITAVNPGSSTRLPLAVNVSPTPAGPSPSTPLTSAQPDGSGSGREPNLQSARRTTSSETPFGVSYAVGINTVQLVGLGSGTRSRCTICIHYL